MKPLRAVAGLLAVALVAGYGYRAVQGIRSGFRFDEAQWLYRVREYEAAIPILERVAVGSNRLHATRLTAESRVELWDAAVDVGGPLAADRRLLLAAAEGFLRCRCIAPASRRSWEGLAEVYGQMEWVGREERAIEAFDPELEGWERVGRPGRISIGMIRGGLRMAPNWHTLLDDLAVTLWAYGIDDEAHEAVRAAALALPLYGWHSFYRIPDAVRPDWMEQTFVDASREVLGRVPLVPPAIQLTDLGKVELGRGEYGGAVEAFEQALDRRNDVLKRAEIEFYLGISLLQLGREKEGRARLLSASENPAFRIGSFQNLASHAEATGDLRSALEYLRRLRQEDPRNLEACLNFARVAALLEDWPAVVEALRWAQLVHPEDPRPQIAMVRAQLDMGEVSTAASLLREIAQTREPSAEIAELRRRIELIEGGGASAD